MSTTRYLEFDSTYRDRNQYPNPSNFLIEISQTGQKTKEQAARDKKRDRFFQGLGFKVLRFTGSEIWADAHACVEEIIFNLNTNNDMRLGLAQ